jgi:CRISPR/Cas system-associated exonuclease Cas4 (RecB family)
MSLVPWSYSKLKAFETCPKQFYHMKVLKQYPQVETEAMRYGTDVHLACEEHIRDGKPIPKKYSYVQPMLNALKPCGFKDKDVWFRGIADLIILDKDNKLAWVVDYKTGKSARYADKGQLELMALAVFIHFPEIKEVRGGLLFVVCKQLITETYSVHRQKQKLIDKYTNKFRQMLIASDKDVWNANPSGLCHRHCEVLECVHNGRN